jgi:hypothetical protein
MRLSPSDRYQQTLFLLFLAFFAGSCVKPPYLQFLLMQHVPTILAALLLAYLTPSSGSQGDIFDGQKDTALATAGAILSISALAVTTHGSRRPDRAEGSRLPPAI